jgi:carnitine O-acetyltransferase
VIVVWRKAKVGVVVSAERKVGLFRDAAKVHIQRAREAGNAMGVDRHMFGGLIN